MIFNDNEIFLFVPISVPPSLFYSSFLSWMQWDSGENGIIISRLDFASGVCSIVTTSKKILDLVIGAAQFVLLI